MNSHSNHTVYIALGSNIGDRSRNLQQAIEKLPPSVLVVRASPVYETPPWGYLDQPPFLNQVLETETSLSPEELIVYLKNLEKAMGREVNFRNSPRKIDLDILFYDDLALQTASLTIPHPRIRGRAFVLVPLADLAPNLCHPVFDLTVKELLDETNQTGIQVFQSDH